MRRKLFNKKISLALKIKQLRLQLTADLPQSRSLTLVAVTVSELN